MLKNHADMRAQRAQPPSLEGGDLFTLELNAALGGVVNAVKATLKEWIFPNRKAR